MLITGAGGAGTIEIIRSLKETGRYRIVGTDSSPYSLGLEMADAGYVVPTATDEQFIERFAVVLDAEQPDYVIPLVDEEIPKVHTMAKERQARLVSPLIGFCSICLDKWQTYNRLRDIGVPVPETWLASEVGPEPFPAIIKPRRGRGSRGFSHLQDYEALKGYLSRSGGSSDDFIVQRRIMGKEFTVSSVVGLGGPFLGAIPKEVIIKRGITLVGVTRHDPAIVDLCATIQSALRADGPFNLQLILDKGRVPYVTEINPRFSTTIALTIAAGVNEADLIIRLAEGEKIETPLEFTPNLMMVRHYAHKFVLESDWPFRGQSEN